MDPNAFPGYGKVVIVNPADLAAALAGIQTVDRETVVTQFRANGSGTGYSAGDVITCAQVWDVTGGQAPTEVATVWYNVSGLAVIPTPSIGTLSLVGTDDPATKARQTEGNAILSAIQTYLESLDGKTPTIGAQLAAASRSITFATDDPDIGQAGTGLAAPPGGAGLLGFLSGMYAGGKAPSYIQGAYANATAIDLITGNSTAGNPTNSWTDVTGWDYFVATFMTDASGSGITVLLEGTNDPTNDPAGSGLLSMDPSSTSFAASQTTASALGASAFQRRIGALAYRYIRFRVSALTAGQVRVTTQFRRGVLPLTMTNNFGAPTTSIIPAPSATSSGVTSTFRVVSAATNNATSVKGSAGSLVSLWAGNNSASWRYIKWFNKATAGTPGTDTSIAVTPLPPGGIALIEKNIYHRFTTGISFAIVAGIAESDNTSIGANEVVVSGTYV